MKYSLGLLLAAALFAASNSDNAIEETARTLTGGDPARGEAAVERYGCGSCHTIPGIRGADGLVGPPLDRIGSRTYIAGVQVNTPENMIRWIRNPPAVDEKTAMPNLRITEAELRDIAAYLYTLR